MHEIEFWVLVAHMLLLHIHLRGDRRPLWSEAATVLEARIGLACGSSCSKCPSLAFSWVWQFVMGD